MKVNNYICPIWATILAMITSVCSAQSGSKAAVPLAIPQPPVVVQNVTSYVSGDTGSRVVGETVPTQPAYEIQPAATGSGYQMPAPSLQACDCYQESCTKCRPKRPRRSCRCKRLGCQGECEVAAPTQMFQTCEGDFCKLSIKKGKEKKPCFTTEQVPVCIPAVRFPWQDCCPPSKSKTRLVTKLKTKKIEVDSCSYKWSVEETNNCGCGPAAGAAPADGTDKPAEAKKSDAKSDSKPDEKPASKSDLEGTIEENVVPPAPEVKGAFLRAFRKR